MFRVKNFVIGISSDKKSKIECRCLTEFGGISIFVGCKWKLLESNCPSVSYSLASNSAKFDSSFDGLVSTEDSSEDIETTSSPTTTTSFSTQETTLSPLEATLEELKKQLEQVKEQFDADNTIQIVKGTILPKLSDTLFTRNF